MQFWAVNTIFVSNYNVDFSWPKTRIPEIMNQTWTKAAS